MTDLEQLQEGAGGGQGGAGEWDDDNDILAALDELGAGAQVLLYRIEGGHSAYVATVDASEFSPELVKSEYGGGRYVARFRDERGHWIRNGTRRFSISRQYSKRSREQQQDDGPPPWLLPLLEAVRSREPAPAAAATDPLKLFSDIGTIAAQQTAQMVALVQTMMAQMKPTRSGPRPEQLLDALRLGAELRSEGNGDGGATGVLAALGPRVLALLEQGAHTTPADPSPATQREESMPIVVPAKESPFAPLAPHMPQLLRLARERADVEVWAVTIDASYPQPVDVLCALVGRLGMDRTFALFGETFPMALEHGEWFRRLFEELLAVQEAEEENDG